jgi:hypothetical protein
MTREELKQAAIDFLGKALKGEDVAAYVVQAAVSILLAPDDEPTA